MNREKRLKLIGDDLYYARMSANVTQMDIAEHLGYTSPQFISNIERGLCFIPANKAKAMCKFYELSEIKTKKIINKNAKFLYDKYVAAANV